jgi:hypothetical protein
MRAVSSTLAQALAPMSPPTEISAGETPAASVGRPGETQFPT